MADKREAPTEAQYDIAFDLVAEQGARSGCVNKDTFKAVLHRLNREMKGARWNSRDIHKRWRERPQEEHFRRMRKARERLMLLNKDKAKRWKAINEVSSFIAVEGLRRIATKLSDGKLNTRDELAAVRLAMEIQSGAMGAAGKTVILTVNNISGRILDTPPPAPEIEGDPDDVSEPDG